MAPTFTILFALLVTTKLTVLIKARKQQPQVPCAFFFGDSLTDNGNNNYLITAAKVNYFPYGIDYPDGPTGRYSNGRNFPDFIAESLGFDKPIPPFATAKDPDFLRGVNYASGGSGILDGTGLIQGGRISLNRQLYNHGITVFRAGLILGNANKAKEHLSKCFYSVNMGSNDYLNNYFLPKFPTKRLYSPHQFAALLSTTYSQQLRTLYKHGARKIAIYGIGQVGCIPHTMLKTNNGSSPSCRDSYNEDAQLFNDKLIPLVDSLNRDLPDAKFIFLNTTSLNSQADPATTGIKNVVDPCCTVNMLGLCVPDKKPCSNRTERGFWDAFHPTENLNHVVAKRAYNAELPSDSYPTDISHLVE